MLWIFMEVGSSNQHNNPTNALTRNGLTILLSNFFEGRSVLMFFVWSGACFWQSFSVLFVQFILSLRSVSGKTFAFFVLCLLLDKACFSFFWCRVLYPYKDSEFD